MAIRKDRSYGTILLGIQVYLIRQPRLIGHSLIIVCLPKIPDYTNNFLTVNKKIHTGGTIEDSGIYRILGTREEMVLSTGDRVPPYDGEAVNLELVRKAHHERD